MEDLTTTFKTNPLRNLANQVGRNRDEERQYLQSRVSQGGRAGSSGTYVPTPLERQFFEGEQMSQQERRMEQALSNRRLTTRGTRLLDVSTIGQTSVQRQQEVDRQQINDLLARLTEKEPNLPPVARLEHPRTFQSHQRMVREQSPIRPISHPGG